MIKAAGKTGSGLPLLLLGLSGENVTRLAAGEPVRIQAGQLAQLGLPQMEIAICYGRTEQDILDEMRAHGITLRDAGAKGTPDGS